MKSQDYIAKFEERLRAIIGSEIIEQIEVPVSVKGARYEGNLTIENYRAFFPEEDNFTSTYLHLKKISPEIARAFAIISELDFQKNEAVNRQDFEKGGQLREKAQNLKKGLQKLIE